MRHQFSPEAIMNSPEKRELVEAIRKGETEWHEEMRRAKKGYAKLIACKVDENLRDKWQTRILCGECIAKFEPPARVKQIGDTGSYQCDTCGKYNESFRRSQA